MGNCRYVCQAASIPNCMAPPPEYSDCSVGSPVTMCDRSWSPYAATNTAPQAIADMLCARLSQKDAACAINVAANTVRGTPCMPQRDAKYSALTAAATVGHLAMKLWNANMTAAKDATCTAMFAGLRWVWKNSAYSA